MMNRFCLRLSIIILFMLTTLLYGCSLSRSSMMRSAGSGDVAALTMLYKEGANLDERDELGRTPLMHALWGRRTDAAKYLIDAGADLNAKDNNGCDVLMYAADYYQAEIIRILIEKGAPVNTRDHKGKTPLIHAVIAEDIDCVKVLIRGGADINAVFDENETAFSMARYLQQKNIQDELLNAGAKKIETAKLTFIREFNPIFMLAPAYISIKNLTTITIKTGDIKSIDINPGKYNLEIDAPNRRKLCFEAKAGHSYYLQIPSYIRKTTHIGADRPAIISLGAGVVLAAIISTRNGAAVGELLVRMVGLGLLNESNDSANPVLFELVPIRE
jgi:hypothetical protein